MAVLLSGYLQSNAPFSEDTSKKTLMTAWFGKAGGSSPLGTQRKWRRDYWSFDGRVLEQRSSAEKNAYVLGRYTIIPGTEVKKTSSKQVDLEVRTADTSDRLSLKASSGAELKPWFEALRKKPARKEIPRQQAPPSSFKKPKKPIINDPFEKLKDLRRQYNNLVTEMNTADQKANDHELQSKLEAKANLAQMNGRLDKLQFVGVDAVVTSEIQDEDRRAKAKAIRKALNADIEVLRTRINQAYAHLSTFSSHRPSSPAARNQAEPQTHDQKEQNDIILDTAPNSPLAESGPELDEDQTPSQALASAAADALLCMCHDDTSNSAEITTIRVAPVGMDESS